jgi:hypothetical protein
MPSALFVGVLLTATSVSISAQTLIELGALRSRVGVALLGAAVLDNVLVILVLSLFLAIATGAGGVITILVTIARLALFGFSWGGHIVFKGGQHEPRIAALIANPAMPDVFRAALAQQQGHNRNDPIAKLVFAQIAWRMGLKISLNPRDIARRFAKAYDYLVYGKADPRRIPCPTLCLAGESEAPITLRIAYECFAHLPHPMKKLIIFTKKEGGAAHCQVNNLALPNRVIFDWLDTVFA